MKINVKPEGRQDIYLVSKEEIINYINNSKQEYIHNFKGNNSGIMLGADWDKKLVIECIKKSDKIGLLFGKARKNNIGHSLAVVNNKIGLECFDIKINKDNLINK